MLLNPHDDEQNDFTDNENSSEEDKKNQKIDLEFKSAFDDKLHVKS